MRFPRWTGALLSGGSPDPIERKEVGGDLEEAHLARERDRARARGRTDAADALVGAHCRGVGEQKSADAPARVVPRTPGRANPTCGSSCHCMTRTCAGRASGVGLSNGERCVDAR